MTPRVLLDADVLYGYTLRDTFMHLAVNKVIEARWTNQIHEEWIEALLENRADLTLQSLQKVRALMDFHAGNALVSGYNTPVTFPGSSSVTGVPKVQLNPTLAKCRV